MQNEFIPKSNIYDAVFVGWIMRTKTCDNDLLRDVYVRWRDNILKQLSLVLEPYNYKENPFVACAFELSLGCSGGCWYCSLSADKLTEVYEYNQNEWIEVVKILDKYLQLDKHCLSCYWATDPFDNPMYELFSDDVFDTLGIMPSVTTCHGASQYSRISNFLTDSYIKKNSIMHRLSVRNRNEYDFVMNYYKNNLAQNVSIIKMFGSDGIIKTISGRTRDNIKDNTKVWDYEKKMLPKELKKMLKIENSFLYNRTTACVCGFIINMCKKSISLVYPCVPSTVYPLGYVTVDERYFTNCVDLEKVIINILLDCYKRENKKKLLLNKGVSWEIENLQKIRIISLFKEIVINSSCTMAIDEILRSTDTGTYNKEKRNSIKKDHMLDENSITIIEEKLIDSGIIYWKFNEE